MDLTLTIALLAGEVIILVVCILMQRRKVDITRPRIIPYGIIGMFMMVLVLATLAHVVALVTGKPVVPRTSKY
jgi:hypothetical protein